MKKKGKGEKIYNVKKIYDVIIIGGSAAGLSAALFSTRRALKTLVLTKGIGGQVAMTAMIENYPGLEKVLGSELVITMEKQARKYGAEILTKEVVGVEKIEHRGEKLFVAKTSGESKKEGNEYFGKTVILANGKTPRSLDVPGESELTGRGVSYCAICDGPLFRDKVVAIVGGGNAALEAALYLSEITKKVYLIHRRDEFRAFESMIKDVKRRKNVELVLNSVVNEIKGKKFVELIVVENKNTGAKSELRVEGVFIEIGSDVDTNFVKNIVELDDLGQVKTSKNAETSQPGIFAAGDVTDTPFKQIVVAAAEGCKAALATYNYLHGIENKYVADWAGHKFEAKNESMMKKK